MNRSTKSDGTHLAASCNHTKFRYVHLNNSPFRHDAKLCIHWRLRIFLYSNDRQLKGCLQVSCPRAVLSEPTTNMKGSIKDSRCVTFAFLNRNAMGRTNLSIFTGFRVNPSPTNVAFVTIRFHALLLFFPVRITLNISSSAIPRTFGNGTEYFAALSLRFCFKVELSAFASFWLSRSKRYVGRAPSGVDAASDCLTLRSS